MASDTAALVALLQIMDSSFPVGTFAHSYGLEQAVRDGRVTDARTLEAFVRSLLVLQLAESDARTAVLACTAATEGDLDSVAAADARLFATKTSKELRDASTATGMRMLQEVSAHQQGQAGIVVAFLDAVRTGTAPGTHPAAAGVVGAAFDVAPSALIAALMFSTANTLVQAAMRLMPVSHRDTQAALHSIRADVVDLSRWSVERRMEPPSSFHPLQEVASMRHEQAPVRFFTS